MVYGLCSVFPIFPINDDIVLYSSLCGMRMRQSTGVREQLSTVCALWMELRTSGGDRKPKSCTSGSSSSVSFSGGEDTVTSISLREIRPGQSDWLALSVSGFSPSLAKPLLLCAAWFVQ